MKTNLLLDLRKVLIFSAFVNMSFLQAQIITTYAYTGGMQTYVVPNGVTLLSFTVDGARGGSSSYGAGGNGGRVTCTLSVVPNSTLNLFVGGMPTSATGGYNGGGNGVTRPQGGGAGGGASDVRIGGTALTDRMIVAGGGGGSGQGGAGVGGGLTGAGSPTNGGVGVWATGGSQSAGGLGGLYNVGTCAPGTSAQSGSLGIGGNGIAGGGSCGATYGGSGGGGGYYGGGGMQINGGAGGSNYAGASTSNVTHSQGITTGNGVIIISTIFYATTSKTNVSCNGLTNGSAAFTPTGINGPYTYSWMPSGGTSSLATNLAAGSYTCIIITTGSTIFPTVSITEPATLSLTLSGQTNASCFGTVNGSATVTTSGGTAPYTYTWSPLGGNTLIASALAAGNYTCQVKDANNCSASALVTITQPASFTVTAAVNNPTICSGNTIVLTGGGANTYSWTGGVTNGIAYTPTISDTYTVTGTNTLTGCAGIAVTGNTVYTTPTVVVTGSTICSGKSFTIAPTGAVTYSYSGGLAIVTPPATQAYTVTGYSTQGCASAGQSLTVTVNATPTLAVVSQSICNGSSAVLTASGAATYSWNTTATTASISANPSSTQSYTVNGTSTGCTSSLVATISVSPLPTITVNSGSICAGQSFTLIPAGASTYTYQGGSIVVNPSATGSYTVSGTSSVGCVSASSATSNITVHLNPTITVNSGSICAGQSFTLSSGGAVSYTYAGGNAVVTPGATSVFTVTGTSLQGCVSLTFAASTITVNANPTISVNSGTICEGQSFTLVPAGASTYTISGGQNIVTPATTTAYVVTGTSSLGCVSLSGITSTVTVNLNPTISVASGSICEGSSFTLSPSGASTYTYSGGSAVVNPSVTTVYTISGISAEGCQSVLSASLTLTVYANPTIAVNSGAICAGGSFTILPTGAATYSFASGSIVSPVTTSSYPVTGFSPEGCSSTPVISTVTVNALPSVSVTASSTTVCVNENPITLTGSPSGGTYSGTDTNGSVFTPTVSGTYTASYSFTDANTCSNSASITLVVDACTGINAAKAITGLVVYPNPTHGLFTIETGSEGLKTITVFDISGKVVLEQQTNEAGISLNIPGVSNGIYYIRVQTASASDVIKLIKQ